MADDFRPGDDDRIYDSADARPGRYGRRSRRLMTALIAVAAILGFGVVLVYAYNKGREAGEGRVPPVIQAQEGPTKVRPETPGGMEVPHRDKEIFNRLEAGEQTDKVERLLPPPEKPVERPVAPPPPPEQMETAAGGEPSDAPPTSPAPLTAVPAPPAPSANTAAETAPAPAPEAPAPKIAEPEPKPPSPARKPETRTAAKTPEPPKPPKPTASGGGWKIQLASLKSEDAARRSWSAYQKKYPGLLGRLSLNVERIALSGGKGTYYRVQAGPIASSGTAKSLCDRLKARKQGCIVVAP